VVLGSGLLLARGPDQDRVEEGRSVDWPGAVLAAVAVAAAALIVVSPEPLFDSVSVGTLYAPLLTLGWLTPLSLVAIGAGGGFVGWEAVAPSRVHALVRPRSVIALARRADWLGAALLAVALSLVVVSFTSADPSVQAVSPAAAWLLPVAVVLTALFVVRERLTAQPLVRLGALRDRAAIGALLTNLAVGAALMTALVDVPILARVTVSTDSQLGAAAVLLRLLVAVPVGALAGGWLCQRLGNRVVAALGLALVAAMLGVMTRWTPGTLGDPFGPGWLHPSDPVLVVAGLGFGLVIAPVNAAMLGAVTASMHGLASALVVVARMIGMLVGLSVLTTIGLRAFYAGERSLPSPQSLCPKTPLDCAPYNTLVTAAIVDELRVVFLGAAACAFVALVIALATLRGRSRDAPLLVS